jgi:UDP-N-acetylglucosamine/UDP-N-acetylgalactosamine diphosphorylase
MAKKKVPCLDAAGKMVELERPNAIRFERFIFDLLPLAKKALVVEVDAAEAFAPVKNSDEEPTDTPRTAKAAMADLHRRWLRAAGAKVADGVAVEINPLWAGTSEELELRVKAGMEIREPTYFSPEGPRVVR